MVGIMTIDKKLTSRAPTFLALLDLFTLPQDITYSGGNGAADDLLELDPEEAGFQSSFSKLGASEKAVHNPVAHVGDAKVYASKEISTRSKERAGVVSHSGLGVVETRLTIKIKSLVEQAQNSEGNSVAGFVQYMGTNGCVDGRQNEVTFG